MKTNDFDDFLASKLAGFEAPGVAPEYVGPIPKVPFYKRKFVFWFLASLLGIGSLSAAYFWVDHNAASTPKVANNQKHSAEVKTVVENKANSVTSENPDFQTNASPNNNNSNQNTVAFNQNNTNTSITLNSLIPNKPSQSKSSINNKIKLPKNELITSSIDSIAEESINRMALLGYSMLAFTNESPNMALKKLFCETHTFQRNYLESYVSYRVFGSNQTDSFSTKASSVEIGLALFKEFQPGFGYYFGAEIEQFSEHISNNLITNSYNTTNYSYSSNTIYDTNFVSQTVYNYYFGVPFSSQQTVAIIDSTVINSVDSSIVSITDTVQYATSQSTKHLIFSIPFGLYKDFRIAPRFSARIQVGGLIGSTRKINQETTEKQQIILIQPSTELGLNYSINSFLNVKLSANYKVQIQEFSKARTNRNIGIRTALIYKF